MKNLYEKLKKRKKYFFIGIPVLLVLFFWLSGNGEKGTDTYVVSRGDISQSVILSGKVSTTDKADLGFASAGRLARVFVQNNQNVFEGQILAQLEIGDLLADLKIKELNSKNSGLSLKDAEDELKKVTIQENTKVESAYRALLTEDLELVPSSNSYSVEPPSVKGIYNGAEGQYKVRIYKKDSSISDLTLVTFGPENVERTVKEEGSTQLGTRGLYISFPDDVDSYEDTAWYLDIPNKTSSEYLANFNTWNEAKNTRDLAIKNAEFEYKKILNEEGGIDRVAEAEIQKIQAEIRKNTIYAPFSGKVTNIEKEVGENASIGERVVSILGEEKLEVVLQVSELDVAKLVPGSIVEVSIDALPGEKLQGILKTVNSRETEIDGVPVYEAFVELPADPRIKTGMSASALLVLDRKESVISVPSYFVKKEGEKNFVDVMLDNGKVEVREVVLGMEGTDNLVEVISGLLDGEKILSKELKK